MTPRMGKRQPSLVRDGQWIAKWTRTRGFEMVQSLAHVESRDHLMAIAGDSLDNPIFWLEQLEYREGSVIVLSRTVLRLWGPGSVQDAMRHQFNSPYYPFKGMRKGRYWELVVQGSQKGLVDAPIRVNVASPFRLKLSHQLALLLYVYGPMSPATAARGLAVSEQQVKGAAAALSRKQLIAKGHKLYEPNDSTREAFRYWLQDELGDRMPEWLRSSLRDPTPIRQRAAELKQCKG